MSEDTTIPAEPEHISRPAELTEPVDSILAFLCHVAQRVDGFNMSVTLDVHGTIISGDLIGRNHWFELLAERLSEAGESGGHVGEFIAETGTHTSEELEAGAVEDYFIHLSNAYRAVESGTHPTAGQDTGLLWRGRVGSVDGWSLGYLTDG